MEQLSQSVIGGGDEYLVPEPINQVPVKRLFDFQTGKLKESMKLPKDFELDDSEILFKIKLIAVNYGRDFELMKQYNTETSTSGGRILPSNIVPCNKFIGKIYASNDVNLDFELDNSKFLVFPHTTCIQQGFPTLCKNCTHYLSSHRSAVGTSSFLPCLARFEFGYNVDGGLQDFIKIKNSSEILIKVPDNVSTHDAALSLDISLPFYSYFKWLQNSGNYNPTDKILLVLSDSRKEMNDVLVVFKMLQLIEKNVTIIDAPQIKAMTPSEENTFSSHFNMVLTFDFNHRVLNFCFNSIISTGLESTKSRYRFVMFNQYFPVDFSNYKQFDLTDKVITEFKLNWFHKFDLIDLLSYLSSLNNSTPRKSLSSVEDSTTKSPTKSVFSDASTTSETTSSSTKGKTEEDYHNNRFVKSHEINELLSLPSKVHWLYYEKDVDLANEFQKTDNSHSTRHINKLMKSNKNVKICYNNRPNKSKVNAFIL
ncbi:hypothetical protein PSN45_001905 [Yamadazyma tenuis]|uniref:Uncharacterized protein n=1 Tax=Candida tenuis (strain ATCC 10573 / BCRC 21748 / CBS 615 / JCM 9827 / NBRC 10315 / NRRL Y-1498 / VKM Y-70) TaxID=590646 RepID=G3BDM7_CANTC|nr:uncharacterized protein CANTEDRAFT_136821 [Yamadazyma tenuis ATCC 10573]EGV60342.1 hypothetical protein CANTEDRAFT_136821 [Yamadazyma tenuis ATCC 10573]WEJ94421.1 hypothetical protein PSN45_001905 [Yamadazyma tenuis]